MCVCVCVCACYMLTSTKPSIKRCTCVNKRRNSGSRWTWDNYITRCHRWLGSVPVGVGVSLGTDASVRISLQTEGLRLSVTLSWATLAKMRKKCCYGQKNFGSICSSMSPSPTHFSHTTNINPSKNKVWEIYFYKMCSFVHWSSSLCLIMFSVYLYMYVAIQHAYVYVTNTDIMKKD